MFLTIAAGFALETRSRLAIALSAAAMVVAALGIHAIPNLAPPIGVAAAAVTWLHRRLALRAGAGDGAGLSWVPMFARYGLVAAIGAACGLCVSDSPKAPALEA